MRVAVLFGGICLSFRKTMDFADLWNDQRGLTGSELGAVRIAEELAAAGHSVTLYTVSADKEWRGVKIANLADGIAECDVAVAINEPDLLRAVPPGAFRVCAFWLNGMTHVRADFEPHVDLFCSPSAPHLHQVLTNPDWRKVETGPDHPDVKATYEPDPSKWCVLPLGCDPERYAHQPGEMKIPGRVVHCSSPDRGFHWLAQEWPAIKRAVPHATLHVFYRFDPWLRGFDGTPFFPAIEALRARALYVEECLRRFKDLGGLDVTLRDSVSRHTIEREMAQAEVLAYPCHTTTWSEGFSCTTLEACAARACPIISDCDALGEVYGDAARVTKITADGSWVQRWRNDVIRALTDEAWRNETNGRAEALARTLTWKRMVERLLTEIETRTARPRQQEASSRSPTVDTSATPAASPT